MFEVMLDQTPSPLEAVSPAVAALVPVVREPKLGIPNIPLVSNLAAPKASGAPPSINAAAVFG